MEEVGEGERREQILRAADDLFSRRGYAAVSLGDVAATVGVSKAALYHHFPSKADLYAAVMGRLLGFKAGAIRAASREPAPVAAKLLRLAEYPIVYLKEDADLDAMMRDADAHLSPVQRAVVADADRDLFSAMEELMREGIDRGELGPDLDPRLLAHSFWHLLDGFVGRRRPAAFAGDRETAGVVVRLFLHGAAVSPRPEAPPGPAAKNAPPRVAHPNIPDATRGGTCCD